MSQPASSLVCAGCGRRSLAKAPAARPPYPFRCPHAGGPDDTDHVMRRVLDPARVTFPRRADDNPFLRYRELLHSYQTAITGGMSDAEFVALVERLTRAVAEVDGRGFVVTPFAPQDRLGARLALAPGRLWVKDETGNVSGSHKARHLMGVMLYLQVRHETGDRSQESGRLKAAPTGLESPGRLKAAPTGLESPGRLKAAPTGPESDVGAGFSRPEGTHVGADLGRPEGAVVGADLGRPVLAIASCGNAALAAAVVARAAGRDLDVFVPTWADESVVAQLRALGATLTVCPREPGVAGDPCYNRFRVAVDRGAIPFCCQGPDNGLTIEGGSTLVWEMIDALGDRRLDRLFVQVGGGALASACAQGVADAVRLGRLARAPRLHTVQTRGGFPLRRAYDRVLTRMVRRLSAGLKSGPTYEKYVGPTYEKYVGPTYEKCVGPTYEKYVGPNFSSGEYAALAHFVRAHAESPIVRDELRYAATHRSECMWPWDTEPKSIATGILDDETYDWLAVVEGMLLSGGYPIVVDEETLEHANALGRETTGINVDHTGTAGLAGLMQALADDQRMRDETVAVIFSGIRR